jgi:hypothetical protein
MGDHEQEHEEGAGPGADPQDPVRETTGRGELRRSPRYPQSGVWTEAERRRHRAQRDAIQRDAGLDPPSRIDGESSDEGDGSPTRSD